MKVELAEVKKNPTGGTGVSWSSIVNGNKQSDQTLVLIVSVNKEITEKARIENNVIISGVGVGNEEEDNEKVEAVLKVLNLDRSKTVKHSPICRQKLRRSLL